MPEATPPGPGRIDHYRLERRLGLGGMAEIFLAVDERSGRRVALKKILPNVAEDSDFRERFFHEIRIQIGLKHPNIVELLDCSPDPARAYIVMEYVDGGELMLLKQTVGRIPWEVTLYVVSQALCGLGAAHAKGIIHRDVKPQNIMWTHGGAVKIGDFGVSHAAHLTRLTATGTVVGTPAHMSPEQARGEVLDARTDVFSMGTVLYELLAGHNPFTADSIAVTLRRVIEVDPEVPSLLDPTIPPSVDGLLRKLHAKDRRARFTSADEGCDAIRLVLAKEGISKADASWRAFLADPKGFVALRSRRLADEAAADARRLLEDRSASPEEALWAAYRTVTCAPDDAHAQTLLKTAAERAGQRPTPVENSRIRELEQALRKDPDNPALLMQLAKLYRLEKDFIGVIRFLRKLREIAPGDAYTRGQIAALVSTPAGAPALRPGLTTPAPPRASPALPAAVPAHRSPWGALLATAAVAALVTAGVVVGRRTRKETALPPVPQKILRVLEGAPATAHGVPAPKVDDVLAKGALLEMQSGPAAALEHYRAVLLKETSPEARDALLFAAADAAERAGQRSDAIASLGLIAASGSPARGKALLLTANLLAKERRLVEATALREELSRGTLPERWAAKLCLAGTAEEGHDALRALVLYEEIVARAPAGPEATAARLRAAGLYREMGRPVSARQMYDEVLRTAAPGSLEEEAARKGIAALEEKGP